MVDWEQPGEAVLEFCRRNPHTPLIRHCRFVGFVEIDDGWVELIDEIQLPGFDTEQAGIVLDTIGEVRGIAFIVRRDGRRWLHAFDETGDSGPLPVPADRSQDLWRFAIATCERALSAMIAHQPIVTKTAYAMFREAGHGPAIDSWTVYTTVRGPKASPPFDGRVEFWHDLETTGTVAYEQAAVAFDETGRILAMLTAETASLQGDQPALILYVQGQRREMGIDGRYRDMGDFSVAAATILRPLLQHRTNRSNIAVPAPPADDLSLSTRTV